MARIRSLKPEIWTDEKFGRLSREARLLFIGLISTADDGGRFRANPVLLRAAIFPYDEAVLTAVEGWLAELRDAGLVRVYEVRGEQYGELPNWGRHQRVDNAAKGIIPEPLDDAAAFRRGSPRVAANGGGPRLDLDLDPSLDPGAGEGAPGPALAGPPPAPVLTFPTQGKPQAWDLTHAQVAEWSSLYPGLDVAGACRKALAWVTAKPERRKSARGMKAFLVRWLNGDADSGKSRRAEPAVAAGIPSPPANGGGWSHVRQAIEAARAELDAAAEGGHDVRALREQLRSSVSSVDDVARIRAGVARLLQPESAAS